MARHEFMVPAEWPELRVRVHPDVHAWVKSKVGYHQQHYSRSMSDVVNEELKRAMEREKREGGKGE